MPNKWADYLITAARYDATGTHIQTVKTRADNGDQRAGPASTATRFQVLSWMQAGWIFCTATPTTSSGGWQKGALIRIVVIDGETFIRTTADNVKADYLGALPGF